jgi:hypothetical protein
LIEGVIGRLEVIGVDNSIEPAGESPAIDQCLDLLEKAFPLESSVRLSIRAILSSLAAIAGNLTCCLTKGTVNKR